LICKFRDSIRELLGVDILAPSRDLTAFDRPDMRELCPDLHAGMPVSTDIVAEADHMVSSSQNILENSVEAFPFGLETAKTALAQCVAADHWVDCSVNEVIRKAPFNVGSKGLKKAFDIVS
jgi:hypothetical protein